MKLLIDAGNTRIKWALVSGDHWLHSGVSPIEQAHDLAQHLDRSCVNSRHVKQVWVSNVAGKEAENHIRAACAARQWQPHFIMAQASQCGVHNGYNQPSQLGSDRWAALIAAWHLTGRDCLVVNSGTATTIDALSTTGKFIGGLILPGLELMQRSLCAATPLEKPVQGEYAPFPLNTDDALLSGALQASCGAIERQHALLDDANAPVLLSGGAATRLQTHLLRARTHINLPIQIMDNLVLQGLLLIAQEEDAS